jgi:hypothetical protein
MPGTGVLSGSSDPGGTMLGGSVSGSGGAVKVFNSWL